MVLAWAIVNSSSSSAERYSISSVSLPSVTFRYGVCTKP